MDHKFKVTLDNVANLRPLMCSMGPCLKKLKRKKVEILSKCPAVYSSPELWPQGSDPNFCTVNMSKSCPATAS